MNTDRQVQAALRNIDVIEASRIERYQKQMSNFWMRRLGFADWDPSRKRRPAREHLYSFWDNHYHLIFTGFSKFVHEKIEASPDVPLYRKRKDIPQSMITKSGWGRIPARVERRMQPDAFFVPEHGKRIYYYYSQTQMETLLRENAPHLIASLRWGVQHINTTNMVFLPE